VEAGFSYDRNSTDLLSVSTNGFVHDQVSANLYATVVHRIIPKFFVTVNGQVQNATFQGGGLDGKTERYYLLGLDFLYQINRYISANAGYNFDRVDSQAGRSYSRNRVYIGVIAGY